MKQTLQKRCAWVDKNDMLMRAYHDTEWGVPLHNDRAIFEFLVLESFQAGLSWRTILYKRKNFRRAFAGFNAARVAKFGAREKNRLSRNAGIIRNRAKIEAAINNARMFLGIQKEFGSFSNYMWRWVKNKPICNIIRKNSDYKTKNAEATAWANDLKKRGFKFLGPTTIYAHMQAVGMVNDHERDCFRR